MTADALCGFLTNETPKVIDLQPAEYAYATFGGALLPVLKASSFHKLLSP